VEGECRVTRSIDEYIIISIRCIQPRYPSGSLPKLPCACEGFCNVPMAMAMGGYPTGRALKPKWAPRMLRGHHIMMLFSVHRDAAMTFCCTYFRKYSWLPKLRELRGKN
jgi:hypothetical protein